MAKLPIKVKAELERIQADVIPFTYSVVEKYRAEELEMDNTDYEDYGHRLLNRARGRLDAYYLMIETMLKAYNCYYGYNEWHVNSDGDRVLGYRRYHFQ